jgi:hypothetical protein
MRKRHIKFGYEVNVKGGMKLPPLSVRERGVLRIDIMGRFRLATVMGLSHQPRMSGMTVVSSGNCICGFDHLPPPNLRHPCLQPIYVSVVGGEFTMSGCWNPHNFCIN